MVAKARINGRDVEFDETTDQWQMDMAATVERNFTYHPPKKENIHKFESLRNMGKITAEAILKYTPCCPEQTLAIRKVEEAIMWANAALARNQE